jgi:virulence-associated protein VagC
MKVKVTEQGLTIPKELLEGIQKLKIRKENHHIVLIPTEETDPIEQLDTQPTLAEDVIAHQRAIRCKMWRFGVGCRLRRRQVR